MEYRQLGSSGLRVPVLSFGAGTFGGKGPLFSAWGQSDATEARRLIDVCLDAGVTLFDIYEGPGIEADKKSLALEVTLQPGERTLTDAELEQVSAKIVAAVAKKTGAVLRS